MTRSFDFVIIGGGILGTALALLAVELGYYPLVLRLPDDPIPNAETLMNMGWLQSGVVFNLKYFKTRRKYQNFALATYYAGLDLLDSLNMPKPSTYGIIKANNRVSEMIEKVRLLKLRDKFYRLKYAEAKLALGEMFEQGSDYFRIPDAPFDGAMVLYRMREVAKAKGAVFVESKKRVQITHVDAKAHLKFGQIEIVTPLVVIAAGAGSFELCRQAGIQLPGLLRQTPLVVAPAPVHMPNPILVDLDRGFSVVRHHRDGFPHGVVVVGTKFYDQGPGLVPDPARLVPQERQDDFATCMPPAFLDSPKVGTFAAGYELIPDRSEGLSLYQPWIKDYDPIIFASPGRATVCRLAARNVMKKVKKKVKPKSGAVGPYDTSSWHHWSGAIEMNHSRKSTLKEEEA